MLQNYRLAVKCLGKGNLSELNASIFIIELVIPNDEYLLYNLTEENQTKNRKMNKPNIFDCGSTELTQDSVLAYIASWAGEKYKDCSEYKYSQEFLKEIISEFTSGKIAR